MAKKKNHIDEFVDYQERQYVPHTHHIQKGELPYSTRQLMKAPGKSAVLCLLLALMGILLLVVQLLQFLQNRNNPLTLVYAIPALAFSVVCVVGAIQNFRKVKALLSAQTPDQKAPKKQKKH